MKPTYSGTLHNIVMAPTESTVVPLVARANRSKGLTEHGVAKRDLERLYWILGTDKVFVAKSDRVMLERMVREGKTATADDLRLLWAEVAGAGDAELAVRLRDMEPCELVKIVDYVEREIIEKE